MGRNLLLIAPAETFVVRGVEAKLKAIGVNTYFSTLKFKEVEVLFKKADLAMIFSDEDIVDNLETLFYLKSQCVEKDKRVIIVGTKDEFAAIKKIIPESLVYRFYTRPLEMDLMLEEVDRYLSGDSPQYMKKSILIVDDDVTYMTMIADWLKDTYRVAMMNAGVNAITWLATNHADLILLDYEMPVTSGPQVLEMIRTQASTADIPVMFLTGKGDKESVMAVMSLKPSGYLLKNIKKEDLRAKIHKFFASQPSKNQ